uniref:Uncharacterized protein n=1 Tax=Anguilla anguilla TaxID=7936 RepID=A0A0E9W7B3_ANGAN
MVTGGRAQDTWLQSIFTPNIFEGLIFSYLCGEFPELRPQVRSVWEMKNIEELIEGKS